MGEGAGCEFLIRVWHLFLKDDMISFENKLWIGGDRMIYASGIVAFISSRKTVPKGFIRKNKTLSLEVIGQPEMVSKEGVNLVMKVRCRFRAILPERVECRSLEDYTGTIKPFIQQSIKNVVLSVEIHHLNYTSRYRLDS